MVKHPGRNSDQAALVARLTKESPKSQLAEEMGIGIKRMVIRDKGNRLELGAVAQEQSLTDRDLVIEDLTAKSPEDAAAEIAAHAKRCHAKPPRDR